MTWDALLLKVKAAAAEQKSAERRYLSTQTLTISGSLSVEGVKEESFADSALEAAGVRAYEMTTGVDLNGDAATFTVSGALQEELDNNAQYLGSALDGLKTAAASTLEVTSTTATKTQLIGGVAIGKNRRILCPFR